MTDDVGLDRLFRAACGGHMLDVLDAEFKDVFYACSTPGMFAIWKEDALLSRNTVHAGYTLRPEVQSARQVIFHSGVED